ncbi:hypothetical protein NpNSSI1_00001995 [Neofusicoccum parvum]|nr:hypothetical protein NpNSSI1_00001995 [Neofusicoccum parvum]
MNYTALMALRELILANVRLMFEPDIYNVEVITAESKEGSEMYEAFLTTSRDRRIEPWVGTPQCETREKAMQVLLEYTENMWATEFHRLSYVKTTVPYKG